MQVRGLEGAREALAGPRLELMVRLAKEWGAGLFVVGGAVRDAFLGLGCPDMDLALTCDPEGPAKAAADRLGGSFFPLDRKRRVFRVVGDGWSLDLAPVKGGDILTDLRARDFTLNSIALELAGEGAALHDPLGGLEDLERGVLRASSDTSFTDDPLRILRGVRFYATRGWQMEGKTLCLIWGAREGLARVAPERVRDELFKVFDTDRTLVSLMLLDRYHCLFKVLPELQTLEGIDQGRHHRVNLFTHTIFTVAGLETLERELEKAFGPHRRGVEELLEGFAAADRKNRALLKLACLYHDLGKPGTRSVDEEGDIHFYGHERLGAQIAEEAARRLALSNREVELVSYLVREHLRPAQLLRAGVQRGRGVARLFRPGKDQALMLLCLFCADYLAKGGGKTLDELRGPLVVWLDHHRDVLSARREKEPLVKGRDLLEIGFEPGPELGEALRTLNNLFWEGEIRDLSEALEMAEGFLREQIP